MTIWKCDKWKKIYDGYEVRNGLRLRFEDGVDEDVKIAFKDFSKWLRKEYIFPVRVTIYVHYAMKIMARDGELVYGTFLGPYDKLQEPYIKISVGDYDNESKRNGKREILISYLHTIAHELTHYFQWVNQLELTKKGEEAQATRSAGIIVDDYIRARNKKKYELLERIEDKANEQGVDENELNILERLSFDEDPNIRGTVAQILLNCENEKAEKILVRLACDKDSLIRAEACYSLGFSETLTTYEMLKDIAINDRNSTARAYAILSLDEIATKIEKKNDIIQFLEKRLNHEKVVYTRIDIYAVLYNLGVTKYLDNILAFLNTKNYQNRHIVVDYLLNIAGGDIVSDNDKATILKALLEQKETEKSRIVNSVIDEAIVKYRG